MKGRPNPSILVRVDIDRSAGERRELLGLSIVIDMAMGDENPLDVMKAETKGLHAPFQGFERRLCLNSSIDQRPGRIIDEIDIGCLDGKRDGELKHVDSVKGLSDHDGSNYHRTVLFSKCEISF